MQITNKKQELTFWMLQLFGWSMMSSFIFLLPFGFSKMYIIYSFITATLFGILITSLYRFYLKKHIDLELFDKKSIIKLIVAFLVCVITYYGVMFFAELLYETIWKRTAVEIKWIEENVTVATGILNIMVTILGWTIIYFAVKVIIRANKNNLESLELNATLREAQLNTLKGQVNPHFMFNSLNNIRGLMLEDVEKSRDMITKLSEMLQYALVQNTVDAISLQEELEMVENYIALSKIQMEDRLEYVKEIAPETLMMSIPPMIIQLLVENASKHGIANLKNGGKIIVTTKKTNEELIIQVSNTGKLSIAKDSTQLGLKNIKQRLHLLYGTKAVFSIEEVNDEVVAKIKIPLT